MLTTDLMALDRQLFFLINQGTANVVLDIVMPAITARGYLLLLPYLVYVILRGYAEKKEDDGRFLNAALWAMVISFLSFLLSDWLSNELKHLAGRVRPCNALEGVRLLVGCTKSGSLPSNHAANSSAVAVTLYALISRPVSAGWRSFPLILAGCIGFSRIYVGVHYPADVLAGILSGSAVSLAVLSLYRYARRKYRVFPEETLLFGALTVISVFRVYYILHGPLDLSPDEAHYWEWARRPDLSYYSKGPMIAYLIWLGTSLFGDTVIGIRIMAVLFSALSSIFLYKLVCLLYGGRGRIESSIPRAPARSALVSALLLQTIPLFAPFGVIFTIDSPFIFFWVVSLFLLGKATTRGVGGEESGAASDKTGLLPWIILGISVGLGLLTKYTMAFFYLCGLLYFIFTEKKALLRTAGPYAAVVVSILVFSPVIIWNSQHDWVTLRHTLGQTHAAEGFRLSLTGFLEFLGSQVGVITPILFVMLFYCLIKPPSAEDRRQAGFLFWFSIPVIAFFLLKSLQGKVQANWAMTGYITGIIAVARYCTGSTDEGKAAKGMAMRRAVISAGVGLALLTTIVAHYPSVLKLPPKLDPSARLKGWRDLGREVSTIRDALKDRGEVLLFSDSYQASSEMSFYVDGHPRTYCVNLGRRMNQYDLWPDMNSDAARMRGGAENGDSRQINGIFVRIGESDMPLEVAQAFERYEKRVLRVSSNNHLLREYSLFLCYNFKGMKTKKPEKY